MKKTITYDDGIKYSFGYFLGQLVAALTVPTLLYFIAKYYKFLYEEYKLAYIFFGLI